MSNNLRVLPVLGLFALASCGGGGSASSSSQAVFELETCSLGCGAGSCAVRQLNTNSDIIFTFNDRVKASSVSFSEINLISTADGGSPTGRFLVDGSTIIFRPSYQDTSEGVSFGFDESTEYTLNLFASPGDDAVVRSFIGRPNTTPIRCTFTATGIQDFVPGAPSVSVFPSESAPPTSRDFNVSLVFDDVIRSIQLLDPDGSSPTVAVSLVSVGGTGGETVFPFEGEFTFDVDIDTRQTTLTFVPIAQFPTGGEGTRLLRVDVSNQIGDLVGNRLLNAGSFTIPLPEEAGLTGEVSENFGTTEKLDEGTSASGLWLGTGALNSGLKPATGTHPGGGHGALGDLDLDGLVFNTTTGAIHSELLNTTVNITDGVFMASSVSLAPTKTSSATGALPFRLFVRGSANIGGTLDCSGEDAPVNFGLTRPHDERLSYVNGLGGFLDPTPEMMDLMLSSDEADGGDGGSSNLASGGGGRGGAAWYNYTGYYNDNKNGWFGEHDGGALADDSRYVNGVGSESLVGVHGNNGGRVGGSTASGAILPAAAAALQDDDLASGSGMGSVAWPPKSNVIPDAADVVAGTWHQNTAGDLIQTFKHSNFFYERFCRNRSRGGGGGGYWTAGSRGDFHDEDPFFQDGFGEDLHTINIEQAGAQNWDFNGQKGTGLAVSDPDDREAWGSFLYLDNLTGAHSIEDASGGAFDPRHFGSTIPFYTLAPADGYLRGGSGGGGAGASEHGSFNNEYFGNGKTDLETYRGADGGGGGAGGGAVQLRVAGDLTITGAINVAGGNGADSAAQVSSAYLLDTDAYQFTRPGDAGGGGGSGGSLLIQVRGDLSLDSNSMLLDGGTGGIGAVGNSGGDGGAGLLRINSASAPDLTAAASMVSPIESYDLGTRPEFGKSGANSGTYNGSLPGTAGDLTVAKAVGTGSVVFNGNSTGAMSGYYAVPTTILFAKFTDYEITCEWSDGTGGGGTLLYQDSNPTTPGVTPIWLAVATAYGFEVNGVIDVLAGSESEWVIPGYNTVGGGSKEMKLSPAQTRLLRFQITFDQDLIQALIGSHPNAYFKVTEAAFPWTE